MAKLTAICDRSDSQSPPSISAEPARAPLPLEAQAAVVTCLDSRVPPAIVFDHGVGGLFVARVAGNFVNDDILGSLEYATKVSGSKLIVIMGHTECAAGRLLAPQFKECRIRAISNR